jgi:hypothetical protein
MTTQKIGPTLALVLGKRKAKTDNEIHFLNFHRSNPVVYQLFEKFAKDLRANGLRRMSGDFIIHRIRWELRQTDPAHPGKPKQLVKVNNNHVAHYTRLYLDRFPQFTDHFHTRHVR